MNTQNITPLKQFKFLNLTPEKALEHINSLSDKKAFNHFKKLKSNPYITVQDEDSDELPALIFAYSNFKPLSIVIYPINGLSIQTYIQKHSGVLTEKSLGAYYYRQFCKYSYGFLTGNIILNSFEMNTNGYNFAYVFYAHNTYDDSSNPYNFYSKNISSEPEVIH